MTDGIRTMLHWISIGAGAIGLLTGIVALVMAAVRRRRPDDTSAPRATAIAVMLIATAAVTAGIVAIWPQQPL